MTGSNEARGDDSATKKSKPKLQSNIFAFFASNVPVPPKKRAADAANNDGVSTNKKPKLAPLFGSTASSKDSSPPTLPDIDETCTKPIVPKLISTPRKVVWQSLHDYHVLVRKPLHEAPRSKVAALDLDGTLVVWRSASWPSELAHYELWNPKVYRILRSLYDQGYKVVLISNQGAIQKAHQGKKATLVKNVMDWIAEGVGRPIFAVLSTRSPKKIGEASFHKPSPKLWGVIQKYLNQSQLLDVSQSFFVGDSADPNDEQGGVDAKFARMVGETYGEGRITLAFHTPSQYFGSSSSDQRKQERQVAHSIQTPPPARALQARLALLGGYYPTKDPILLILCGVQGSGKSTFCQHLTEGSGLEEWAVYSQDTINNGKPGRRESVEEAAREALDKGTSVAVDRMHLDVTQRAHFVSLAQQMGVQAHIVVLAPPKEVLASRLRERTNHPGGVQGEDGVRHALRSLEQLQLPTYDEDVELISVTQTGDEAIHLALLYRATRGKHIVPEPKMEQTLELSSSNRLVIPSIILGTMGIGKRITDDTITAAIDVGITGIDTAPTYNNEDKIGEALANHDNKMFCVAKVPKTATNPDNVRGALDKTLEKLQRCQVDTLLLHWPSDVIAAGTLEEVWKEMEACVDEGKCRALGVCNFNVNALAQLLSTCRMPPVINQVERHPLLPQTELLDFCARNHVKLQAHSPLGQGNEALLSHEVVKEVAKTSGQSPAQVVLRWNLQQGVLVVPKSKDANHMKEFLTTKILTPGEMGQIDGIATERRFVAPPFMYGTANYCWDEKIPRV